MHWVSLLIGVSFILSAEVFADTAIVKLRGDLDLSIYRSGFASRKKLVADLKAYHAEGAARVRKLFPSVEMTSLWVLNSLKVTAEPEVIRRIQAINGIERVDVEFPKEVSELEQQPFSELPRGDEIPPIPWGIEKIGAPSLWAQGIDGRGVVVAMIDSGVNFEHPDLQSVLWQNPGEKENGIDDDGNGYVDDRNGYNFEQKNGKPIDDFSHGSRTAGIVAGTGVKGVKTGVAPGARLMILKTCCNTFSNAIFESTTWEAIQYAIEQGAHVINMSLTSKHTSNPDYAKWRRLGEVELAAGLVHVNSAGNGGSSRTPYNIGAPASNPPAWFHPDQVKANGMTATLTVGSTDPEDNHRSFSSTGPVTWADYIYVEGEKPGLIKPDICAPSDVPSTDMWGSEYTLVFSGTSSSAPHVSGVVAMLLSVKPSLSVAQITEAIQMSAAPVPNGFTPRCGAGRVDAVAAVDYVKKHF